MNPNVQFDEDKFSQVARQKVFDRQTGSDPGGGFSGWLIKHHLAKTHSQAQLIQLLIIVVNILITFYALYRSL